MQFALLSYNKPQVCGPKVRDSVIGFSTNPNIGDYIQGIAVKQHLPRVDGFVSRDWLNSVDGGPWVVCMNGWFSHIPSNWPPNEHVVPVFFGFHVAEGAYDSYFSEVGLRYFRDHQPIGCRDDRTRDVLRAKGIEAYTSGCLTSTFPIRPRKIEDGPVFFVDTPQSLWKWVPTHIRERAVKHSHMYPGIMTDETKYHVAEELLNLYRDSASLIVTSRLHCALPCLAMGIPVIFARGPNNRDIHRTAIVTDLVQTITKSADAKRVCWDPSPVNFEEEKHDRIATFKSALESVTSHNVASV